MKKNRLTIRIISIVLIIGILVYLNFTNRFQYLINFNWKTLLNTFSTIEKWLLSTSLLSIIILNIAINIMASFIYSFFQNKNDNKTYTDKIETDKISKIINDTVSRTYEHLKSLDIDPRDIETRIKSLPFKKGEIQTKIKVEKWYNEKEISSNEKDMLFVVINLIFEQSSLFDTKNENLESNLKLFADNLNNHFKEGNAAKIQENYYHLKDELMSQNIRFLKKSIEATEILFSITETKNLYKELLILEPTAQNYIKYGYFLQNIYDFDDAIIYYEKAINFHTIGSDKSDSIQLQVAILQNNLSRIYQRINNFELAITKCEKAIIIYKDLSKNDNQEYLIDLASSLSDLAFLYLEINDFDLSESKFFEALQINEKIAMQKHDTYFNVAISLHGIANMYLKKGEKELSIKYNEKALATLNETQTENIDEYNEVISSILYSLGHLFNDLNKSESSLNAFKRSLEIRTKLAESNALEFASNLALTHIGMGELFLKNNDFIKTMESFQKAIDIFENLPEKHQHFHKPEMSLLYYDMGNLYSSMHNMDQAFEYHLKSLDLRMYLHKMNSPKYIPLFADSLFALATCCAQTDDLKQALEYYIYSLKIKTILNNKQPDVYLSDIAMIQHNIGMIYSDKNRLLFAKYYYEESLKTFRKIAKTNPNEHLPNIASALTHLALVLSQKNFISEAKEKYTEALKINRELSITNPTAFLPDLANTLFNMSLMNAKLNNTQEAISEYEESVGIYEKLSEENPDVFGLNYVKILIFGVSGFNKEKDLLKQAQILLSRFDETKEIKTLNKKIVKLNKSNN